MFAFFIINLLLYKCDSAPSEFINNDDFGKKEVIYGEILLLQCKSNNFNYNFDYWLFDNKDIVIGPSNSYDKQKYKYEILSGNLTVKAATKDDEGRYSCISKALRGQKVNIKHVDVMILQKWEQINEHDSDVNTIRILMVSIVMLVVGAGAYALYMMWKERYLYPIYLEQSEDEDEDSGDEIFSAPSTSKASNGNRPEENTSFDNISTDFKSILNTTTNK